MIGICARFSDRRWGQGAEVACSGSSRLLLLEYLFNHQGSPHLHLRLQLRLGLDGGLFYCIRQ